MKKIFMLDDNIDRVLEIFGKIYKMLWKGKNEEGIAAKVVFFGDQFKKDKADSELQQENIDFFIKTIKNMLRSHCRDEEQWEYNGEMFQSKKQLIENVAKNINIFTNKEIEDLVTIWKDREILNESKDITKIEFSPLINCMLEAKDIEGISQSDIYILLDVILLFDDMEQVGNGVPIISMGLYNALTNLNYKCYLYSSYAYDYMLIDNYKEIYQKRYGETIEVYHSNDFFTKEIHSKNCLFYKLNE